MGCRVSRSALSGSLEPKLMSVVPLMARAAPHTRLSGCEPTVASSACAVVTFWQMARGFWFAGLTLTRASTGLTPTPCGPSSGYSLEPRVRAAVTCDRPSSQSAFRARGQASCHGDPWHRQHARTAPGTAKQMVQLTMRRTRRRQLAGAPAGARQFVRDSKAAHATKWLTWMHCPAARLRLWGMVPVVVGVKVTGPLMVPVVKVQSFEVDTDSCRVAKAAGVSVLIVLVVLSTLYPKWAPGLPEPHFA